MDNTIKNPIVRVQTAQFVDSTTKLLDFDYDEFCTDLKKLVEYAELMPNTPVMLALGTVVVGSRDYMRAEITFSTVQREYERTISLEAKEMLGPGTMLTFHKFHANGAGKDTQLPSFLQSDDSYGVPKQYLEYVICLTNIQK